ncbi:putative RNA helicase [Polyrhizophydium stewartii]|uniref:RNA helicase n=1 Tax=Polyrhizophydium stewartii TaxID=2732419 RepID=A0ABR4NJS1_9FUNG
MRNSAVQRKGPAARTGSTLRGGAVSKRAAKVTPKKHSVRPESPPTPDAELRDDDDVSDSPSDAERSDGSQASSTSSAADPQQSDGAGSDDSAESDGAESDLETAVTPGRQAPAQQSFEAMGLQPWLVDSLRSLSIRGPTEIQQACIPHILAGKDVIGGAKTGSGKTAAFALPILQKLSEDPYGVFALVLTPTRELAFQIAEQFRVLGTGINLRQSVVVGGMDMMTQAIEMSRKPHIIIATPGRLVDHIRSSADAIHFKRLRFLVLDEADRLLDGTFSDDLDVILGRVPKSRQTLLFTATMSDEINALQAASKEPPFVYECAERYSTVDKLDQRYVLMSSGVRDIYLAHIIREKLEGKTMIIFASKCRTCEMLRIMLKELGLKSTALHSQMSQNDRIGSLAKFKSGIVPILIATDVGSRGLDIPTVQVVVNYELPADATDYIHRVGRTARAGRGGLSLSFVTERDVSIVLNIESKTKKKMAEYEVAENEVLEIMSEVNLAKRVANMQLFDTDFGSRKRINKQKQGLASSGRVSKKSVGGAERRSRK